MRIFEAIGIGVLGAVVVLLLLFARRGLLARGGGTIEMSVRLGARVPGRGWALGFGRFSGDQFRWFRTFSFALRPRRILSRRDLVVTSRRVPEGPELLALTSDVRVLTCVSSRGTIEIAMTEGALTGFLSWLEAAPREAASYRMRALPTIDDQAVS